MSNVVSVAGVIPQIGQLQVQVTVGAWADGTRWESAQNCVHVDQCFCSQSSGCASIRLLT